MHELDALGEYVAEGEAYVEVTERFAEVEVEEVAGHLVAVGDSYVGLVCAYAAAYADDAAPDGVVE